MNFLDPVIEGQIKNGSEIKRVVKFILVQLSSNLLVDLYILLRKTFFNETCFINEKCPLNCKFTTRIFLFLCFFLWRSTFEMRLLYLVIFFNKKMRENLKLRVLYLILCFPMICLWFLYIYKYIPSDQVYLSMDIMIFILVLMVFLPILASIYKLSMKIFFMHNALKFLIFFLLFSYFSLGSGLLIVKKSLETSFYGQNYYYLIITTFLFVIDIFIRFAFKKLFTNLKKRNILNSIAVLKMFTQGVFGFSTAAQISVVASSSFHDISMYYQYSITIYSNFMLMSNDFIISKLFRAGIEIFFKSKRTKISIHVEHEHAFLILCSQKMMSLIALIPRLIFLFIRYLSSPLTYSFIPSCFGDIPSDFDVNYYSMGLLFMIEIFMFVFFYFSWSPIKKTRFRKYLFEDRSWVLMIFSTMSYPTIFEVYVLYFINIKEWVHFSKNCFFFN